MNPSTLRIWLVLAALLFLATACATKGPQPKEQDRTQSSAEKAERAAETSAEKSDEVPASVDSALLPEKEPEPAPGHEARTRAASEPRFDIRANEVPARQFFMSLVRDTSASMTVHPDVSGRITLQMRNATLTQVLDAVRNLYGYPYRSAGRGYQILPAGVTTRTFHVDYLSLIREGGSKTQVRSGSITEDENGNGDSVTSTSITTSSENAFWSELEKTLSSIVGQAQDRRVITQPQAGLVVVRASPRELEQVDKYLGSMQRSIQRQVILEAKIVEVRLNEGHQSGINWSGLLSGSDGSAVISQTGGGTAISEGTTPSSGQSLNSVLDPNARSRSDLSTGAAAEAFGGVFSAAVNFRNFTTFIELLKAQGEVNVLSSPRVSTMNNQKAVIKVGTDEFFVTDVSTETDEDTAGDETQINDVTLDPFFSGIALDVTPSVSRRDKVTMHIHPSVSTVTEEKKTLQLAGDQISLPLAQSEIRESDTIVKARDGEIVAIGGLMKSETISEQVSVPLLGDIPVLGHLFRQQKHQRKKTELVILLRPKVIGHGRENARIPEPGHLGAENFGRKWRGGAGK